MKEKRNLYYLVDVISAQTHLDPKVVKFFITQLFKEIEKGLMVSPVIKIDNFGFFRVIKSLSADKILFLGKFKNEGELPSVENFSEEKSSDIQIEKNIFETKFSEENSEEANDYTHINFRGDINDHVENHQEEKDVTNNYITNSVKNNVNKEILELEESYYNFDKQKEKKERSKKIRNVTLSLVVAITILGFLFEMYLFPTGKKIERHDLHNPIYTELENQDTINFAHIIVSESVIDFIGLSKMYYGNDIFWPYLYSANKNGNIIPLEIRPGTIIKIPKLDKSLIDASNKSKVDSVEFLAREILNRINQTALTNNDTTSIKSSIENEPNNY